MPVGKPQVCAELADLEEGISQSAKEANPLIQCTGARKSPVWAQCLAQVPGWPGSLDAACLCSHLENTKVALRWPSATSWHPLPQVVAQTESSRGSCRSSLSTGQLQGHTGHSCSRSQRCLHAQWPVLTVAVEAPCHLQDLPEAGQILLRIRLHGPAHGLLGSQHSSHVSPRDLRSLGNAKVDLVGFGKDRRAAPAALWRDDSCLGCKKARKPACACRPLVSHHSSSFLLHGLIVPELQILPKVCPLSVLLCWLAGITLFLCSLSEQQQHLSPCSLSKSA